jgi:hypothetical protein
MNTDQARRIITLHDNAERALANLRNAGAMSTDDPRATEMLESAGGAYLGAIASLHAEEAELIGIYRDPSASEQPAGDCDDLCKCGHERFAHMANETEPGPCAERGCGCSGFDLAPAEDSGQGDTPEDA